MEASGDRQCALLELLPLSLTAAQSRVEALAHDIGDGSPLALS